MSDEVTITFFIIHIVLTIGLIVSGMVAYSYNEDYYTITEEQLPMVEEYVKAHSMGTSAGSSLRQECRSMIGTLVEVPTTPKTYIITIGFSILLVCSLLVNLTYFMLVEWLPKMSNSVTTKARAEAILIKARAEADALKRETDFKDPNYVSPAI